MTQSTLYWSRSQKQFPSLSAREQAGQLTYLHTHLATAKGSTVTANSGESDSKTNNFLKLYSHNKDDYAIGDDHKAVICQKLDAAFGKTFEENKQQGLNKALNKILQCCKEENMVIEAEK